uniref:AAA ATPase domain-containing protein n=1 Tax=Candidatus Kentrum sp. FW TaxID=2126338 RepID=A0A450U290_9GAMM|nr:MAG: AAA ATPase domain-containing protein [Candidatus Kentron sp. FW]
MKIRIENLGALQQAEFTLGDLTIICGENNTGKTYATYALYGFLYFWKKAISIRVPEKTMRELLSDGATTIDIIEYQKKAHSLLDDGCTTYNKQLPTIFAAQAKKFEKSTFRIDAAPDEIRLFEEYEHLVRAAGSKLFSITKDRDCTDLVITLLVEQEALKIPREAIRQVIGDALKEIIFSSLFPAPFIASAERTGAAIFRKELNFARNRLMEEIGKGDKDIDPMDLFFKVYTDYALPVKQNVEFTRQLEAVSKEIGFVAENHPDILEDFSDILGGEYTVDRNDELYFSPKGKRIKLSMDESASAVRSLLDMGFYLKHVAKPGDILIVDEPELNLHPENQRRVARLFARLVNLGIKIFITTHSDYLIKELNTLIMLNQNKPHLKEIAEREGYRTQELLSGHRIKVYIAEKQPIKQEGKKRRRKGLTLTMADIDPELGIEARSFDKTIGEMNRIQDEIMWGEE